MSALTMSIVTRLQCTSGLLLKGLA